MLNKKLIIGLVFGGNSGEHEVSIKSAKTIYNALSHSYNLERFIVNPIYIDKNLAAIFCVWDRVFGTYCDERDD